MLHRLKKALLYSALGRLASAGFDCSVDSAQGILPEGATALRALSLPDNSTFGDPTEVAYPNNASSLPALCLLTINVTSSPTSSFRFGVFLPEDWNGRFATVGNGGLAGGINWPAMGIMARYKFAVMSTDTGHNGTSDDGQFALNNPESVTDNWWRAMSGSIDLAKEIVTERYERNISYSYYNGCSTGGRQGLLDMQLNPEHFDGVLAGAPAWETTKISPYLVQIGAMNLPNTSDHHIPASHFPLVQAEAMRQCDGVDGVEDGVISNPAACHFRPETLLCAPGQNTTECLTDPQINTLHLVYGDYFEIDRPLFYYPPPVGSEPEWRGLLPSSAPISLGVNSFAYIRLQDPDWDWRNLNISLIAELSVDADTAGIPDKFDLRPFAKRGGKLLQYHGLADSILPYGTSQRFYDAVYRNISSHDVDYSVDDFYRLFYVPGMLHCASSNGNAPWYFGAGSGPFVLGDDTYSVPGYEDAEHDAILALIKWVEEDVAPEWITATKFVNETVELGVSRQRKLCPYPKTAQLVGEDVDAAESWDCSAPE